MVLFNEKSFQNKNLNAKTIIAIAISKYFVGNYGYYSKQDEISFINSEILNYFGKP